MTLHLTDDSVRASITLLEQDNNFLPIEKANILMVADGSKPASWQILFSDAWNNDAAPTPISAETWQYVGTLLGGLGLVSLHTTRLDDTTFSQPQNGTHLTRELGDIFIARDMSTAQRLADAIKANDDTTLGELFGFPKTSIQAYADNHMLAMADEPTETATVTRDDMCFLNHRLSQENWKDEISYLPSFAARIKEISPSIYADCTRRD